MTRSRATLAVLLTAAAATLVAMSQLATARSVPIDPLPADFIVIPGEEMVVADSPDAGFHVESEHDVSFDEQAIEKRREFY